MPSSKIWHSLLSLPGKLTPQVPLVHSLTFFNSVLKYHFAREASPDQSIWNSGPQDPSLPFLSLTVYHLLTYLFICLLCVSHCHSLPSPRHLTDLCVYIWLVCLSCNIMGAQYYLFNKSRWAFNSPLTCSVHQPGVIEQSLYARHCVKSLSYGKWKDMVPACKWPLD